jgi:serine protease Do
LSIEQNEGIIVFSVERNSPANEAKIEPGDIILEINGMKVLRQDDFLINVLDARNGQKLSFKLLRDGKEINTTLTLKPRKR